MVAALYRSSPTNLRRSRADMDAIRTALVRIVAEQRPMTVRQVFYQAVSRSIIGKTESEYKHTVVRLLTELRRDGYIPYGWIADNTRWQRKPKTFDSVEDALYATARLYRRAIWTDAGCYVEVWLEKDALAGVLLDVTDPYDVPLMVTRGYPSVTYLHEAAEAIACRQAPAYIYYFGDHDPPGVDIPRNVEESLRKMAPDTEIHFERIAVNRDQIRAWRLPMRPTKQTDSLASTFLGVSVEVDAIPPQTLRQLAQECIARHVDEYRLRALRVAEESERTYMRQLAQAVADRSGAEGGKL
jgi:hypothetical protein